MVERNVFGEVIGSQTMPEATVIQAGAAILRHIGQTGAYPRQHELSDEQSKVLSYHDIYDFEVGEVRGLPAPHSDCVVPHPRIPGRLFVDATPLQRVDVGHTLQEAAAAFASTRRVAGITPSGQRDLDNGAAVSRANLTDLYSKGVGAYSLEQTLRWQKSVVQSVGDVTQGRPWFPLADALPLAAATSQARLGYYHRVEGFARDVLLTGHVAQLHANALAQQQPPRR